MTKTLKQHHNLTMPSKTRRGTVIVLVLVVIVVLSLAVISFAKLMQAERNGADHNMRQIQTRYLAESGIDAVRTLLLYDDQKLSDMGGVYNNENELCGVLVTDAKDPRDVGRFTVIAPRLDENGMLADLRYGLEDESAKIDLRMVLACEKAKPGAGRQILLGLPGVDETIADSILDWLDEDDDPRDYGAESDYYEGLDPPYKARNGMIESIDELAMVNGVTPALLYGADWNRNGFIDTAEPDPQTLFGDNTSDPDELLDCGLAPYLTVSSAENQKATDGSDKINVNADDLTTLQSQLTQKLNNADQVNYILAYRLFGTTSLAVTDESESDNTTNTADSQSRSSSGNSQNNSQGSSQDNGSGSQDGSSTDNSGSQSSSSGANQGSGTNTSQSFDLTQTPQAKIFSVLDLVGGSLQVRYSGSTTTETLTSPFTEASVATDMPVLLDAIKFDDGEYSRVNINQAPKAVLLAIPGMTDEAADAIIANRISDPIELADADITEMQYPIWPLLLEYIDFDTMKAIAPYVTTQGTVMSAQIVGRFDAKSPAARLKVWFDTSVKPAKILKIQDLSDLGPGFAADVLGVNQNTQATFSTGSAVQNAMY